MRVVTESDETRKQRRLSTEAALEAKRARLDRRRNKGLSSDVELVKLFNALGLGQEFLKDKEEAFKLVPQRLEGRKREFVSDAALEFLVSEFNAELLNPGDGNQYVHFKPKGDDVNLLSEVAEKSGQKRAVVNEVYTALRKCIRINLKNERRVNLPDLGILKLVFKPAREKKKGVSPFTKKPMVFKAKPASNKLKFRPSKKLRAYIEDKIGITPPKKK